jgi:Chagasin family peptidase inhibitor I42
MTVLDLECNDRLRNSDMAMRTAALVLSLSLIPLAAMAQERSETHKKVSANAPFEIKLVANPSTGYQWKIDTAESAGLDRLSVNDLGTSPPPQMSGEPRRHSSDPNLAGDATGAGDGPPCSDLSPALGEGSAVEDPSVQP